MPQCLMPDYRIYILANDDHITKRVDFDCSDDNAAIEIAKQHIDGRDIELWQRDRRIARFDSRPKDTGGWIKGGLKPPE
jgi:hypothetical protein